MTLVTIDLGDVAGGHDPDDHVIIRAEAFRESPGGGITSTAEVTIPLVDGVGQREVKPGPVVVSFRCQAVADTREKRGVVPNEGPVDLGDVIAGDFVYTPAVVSQVALDAQRAEDAADSAETVAAAFGSLEGVQSAVDGAASSAAAADGSATAAAGSATAAASSASAAAGSATAADSAAARAENVAESTHWEGDRLSVMGVLGPPLTGDDGETPHIGAGGTWWVGDTDTGVRAQGEKGDPGDGAGDVLWSELNPILDGKAAVSRVTALEGNQPIIVSSLPASPLPGRIYLVTG